MKIFHYAFHLLALNQLVVGAPVDHDAVAIRVRMTCLNELDTTDTNIGGWAWHASSP